MKRFYLIFFALILGGIFYFTSAKQTPSAKSLTTKKVLASKVRSAYMTHIRASEGEYGILLEARIERRVAERGFSYEWRLPQHVQLLSGELSGYIEEDQQYIFLSIEVDWQEWPDKQKMIYLDIHGPNHLGYTAVWFPKDIEASKELEIKGFDKPNLPADLKIMQ
tara:strand:- start:7815 stop:8309 length:495 start_codon:yes stop_codon:yes gene_type:complete